MKILKPISKEKLDFIIKILIMIKFCKLFKSIHTTKYKFDKDEVLREAYESLKKLILNIKKTNGRNAVKK